MSQGLEVISLGELIVEVMRVELDQPLDKPAHFTGPFPSGAPAIFADQVARLGHPTGFIGAVGPDDFGKCILDRFAADGVDARQVAQPEGYATGVAFVTYFSDGSRKFLYHIANAAAGQMPEIDAEYVGQARFLHICGSSLSVSERMRRCCYEAVQAVKARGGRISFDPNLRPELLGGEEALRRICGPVVEAAYVVLPSGAEAEILTGVSGHEAACRRLLEMGPSVVALKRGAKGCEVFTREQRLEVPAFPVEAVDPTGAGDCFDAGFVVGLLEGLPLEEVGALANACGALGATKKGPMEGAFFRDQVEAFIAQRK